MNSPEGTYRRLEDCARGRPALDSGRRRDCARETASRSRLSLFASQLLKQGESHQ